MDINYLKLKSKKTKLLVVGSKSTLAKMENRPSLSVDGSNIGRSTKVKSLGIILDSTLSCTAHINTVARSAFFYLRSIARLCPSLSQQSAEVLVNAYVISSVGE